MSWLPGIVQGFTSRNGGTSDAPYASLNLSYNVGDDPARVQANRDHLAACFGMTRASMVYAEQVHSDRVAVVDDPTDDPVPGVDALVTSTPGLLLTQLYADCVPVYIVDPLKRVIALVHSGWRGTSTNIVYKTTRVLQERFDVQPRMCQVAVGPSIAGDNYEVDVNVVDAFRDTYLAGASTAIVPRSEWNGKFELHLRRIIFSQLLTAGYKPSAIAVCEEDTFANEKEFFSHRRESKRNRKTGRMAAILGIQATGSKQK